MIFSHPSQRAVPAPSGVTATWFGIQHHWVVSSALSAACGGCALYAAAAAKPDSKDIVKLPFIGLVKNRFRRAGISSPPGTYNFCALK